MQTVPLIRRDLTADYSTEFILFIASKSSCITTELQTEPHTRQVSLFREKLKQGHLSFCCDTDTLSGKPTALRDINTREMLIGKPGFREADTNQNG